jgi:hypothetical protein
VPPEADLGSSTSWTQHRHNVLSAPTVSPEISDVSAIVTEDIETQPRGSPTVTGAGEDASCPFAFCLRTAPAAGLRWRQLLQAYPTLISPSVMASGTARGCHTADVAGAALAGSGLRRRQEASSTPGINPMHHIAGREIMAPISRQMLQNANKSWIKGRTKAGGSTAWCMQ